jgi:predicted phosphodiesterase
LNAVRVLAVSDIHADHRENLAWVLRLPHGAAAGDVLLVAGDVSHRLDRLAEVLCHLRSCFGRVFFVPGNHEAWLGDDAAEPADSLAKLRRVLDLCEDLGVETGAARLGDGADAVWIVPLLGWYEGPDEADTSLFVPKPGEDASLSMWVDRWAVRWPDFGGGLTATDVLLGFGGDLPPRDGAPVITFSHFLPRRELIPLTPAEHAAWAGPLVDPAPAFNFSRVAGTRRLDERLRAAGSVLHVYGHQHRNRAVSLDGVRYVSHCLGTPRERAAGRTRAVGDGPRVVWRGGVVP